MDPDASLSQTASAAGNCRTLIDRLSKDEVDEIGVFMFWVIEMMEGFSALDSWMKSGGFLPTDWVQRRLEKADSHAGYKNRETWALHLWLTNDEDLYEMSKTLATGCEDIYEAVTNVRGWVDDVLVQELERTELGRTMLREVGSFWRVDWKELTEALRAT